MTQDQKGCKKNNIRAEEEQTTAARTKHEDEENTGIRPAGRKNKGTKRNTAKRTKQARQQASSPPLPRSHLTQRKQTKTTTHCRV